MRYFVTNITTEQLKQFGGTDIQEAPHIGGFFATLNESHILRLQSLGYTVRKVGKVKTVEITTPTPIATTGELWSIDTVLEKLGMGVLKEMTDPPLDGAGFNAAILDTGIRGTHELIPGAIIYSKNFVGGSDEDVFNHGTAVASLISTIAPKSGIVDFKVLGDDGEGSEENVVMAIDEAIGLLDTDTPVAMIHMSLGSPDDGDPDNPVRVACRAAMERGIWISAAAGNDGPEPETINCPACERYVFASGSLQSPDPDQMVISEFSSRGPTKEGITKPDYVFPGENILVASSESDTATFGRSGTSFSAPFTAGQMLLHFNAMNLIHGTGTPLTWLETPEGIEPSFVGTVSPEEGMDYWGPKLSIKPLDAPQEKDDTYGYGMPFGYQVASVFREVGGQLMFSELIPSVIIPIFMISMMGMLMRGMMPKVK